MRVTCYKTKGCAAIPYGVYQVFPRGIAISEGNSPRIYLYLWMVLHGNLLP